MAATRPVWRKVLAQPLVWAALCAALALPFYLARDGLAFPAYLLTLVSGWFVGFTFVGATLRTRHPATGWVVHIAGAMVGGFVLFVLAQERFPFVELPEPAGRLVFFVQMAAIPAIGWTWVTLVGRVSRTVGSGSSNTAKPALPEWTRSDDAWVLEMPAVPVRVRILNLVAGVVWVVAAGAVAALLMVFYDLALRAGPAVVILVIGVVVILPAYGLFSLYFRPRTLVVRVLLDRSVLRIDDDPVVSYRDIDELVWREEGAYARLEFRARGGREGSFVAGVAHRPKTVAPGLPPLPKSAIRALEAAGLESSQISRRARGVVFRRRDEDERVA